MTPPASEETLPGATFRLAMALLVATILGLAGWIMSQGERVAALEATDKSLGGQIGELRDDVKEVKQDVRDIHKYLLPGDNRGH